jgi:transposase
MLTRVTRAWAFCITLNHGNTMSQPLVFVGIDVSKDHLDVAFRPTGEAVRFTNDERGIAALLARLKDAPPELIVLESTGGYEQPVAVAVTEAGWAARIIDPTRARAFAKSLGQHSKTDAIDARVLAQFAEAVRPEARVLPDAQTRELQALVDRRAQWMGMQIAEGNRLKQRPTAAVKTSLQNHLKYIASQIAELEQEIKKRVKAHPDWGPRDQMLRSIPGVGDQTAHMLLGRLPELGTLTGKQIAALAGLAPRARDSGKKQGERSIYGGRKEVRSMLFMASLSASRHNPFLKALYQRLMESGKRHKVALTAVARKLLTIANAIIRDMTPWTPNHTPLKSTTAALAP